MSLNLDRSAWKRVLLGDVAVTSKERVDPTSGDVDRYVAGEHMDTDSLKIHRWGEVGEGYLGPAFHRRFHPGQVLYGSRRTYLRKVAVAEFGGVTANTTFVVETRDPSVLLQEFLPFVMTAEPFHAFAIQESKGSVNPYVNWSDIARYEFALPPLDEQKRLASLLWTTEKHQRALRAERESALIALRVLRADSVNNPGAKAVRAKDAFEFSTGVRRTPDRATGPNMTPYLRSANVGYGELNLSDVLEMHYDASERDRFALKHGDVLVTEGSASASAVGMPAKWADELPGPVCFQMTLLRLRAIPDICLPEFLFHWSMWAYESGRFLDVAGGTNIRHISAIRSAEMEVRVPPLDRQATLVAQLGLVTKGVEAIECESRRLADSRAALLAGAFGGHA